MKIASLRSSELFSDALTIVISNIFSRGIFFLLTLFLSKHLSQDDFGGFSILKNNFTTIGMVTTIGLSYAANKFIAASSSIQEKNEIASNSFLFVFIFSAMAALTIVAFASQVSGYFLGKIEASWIYLGAVFAVSTALMSMQTAILSGFNLFKFVSFTNVFVAMLSIFAVTLSYNHGMEYIFISFILPQVFFNLTAWRKINYYVTQPIRKLYGEMISTLLKFSFPLFTQEVVFSLSLIMGNKILLNYGGLGQVGTYNAAYQIYAILIFLPLSLNGIILNRFSRNKDTSRFIRLISLSMLVFFMFINILVYFALPFISGYFSGKYFGISQVIMVLSLSAFFAALGNIFIQWMISVDKTKVSFLCALSKDVSFLIFMVVFCQFSIGGIPPISAALAFLASNIIYLVVSYHVYQSYRRNHE